jgi:hypothetical protein
MVKEKTPEQVYDDLVSQGYYEEANLDKSEINKILKMALEDFKFGQQLRSLKNANWRIILNIHYDVLRELCSLLMRFKKQKISNHQGLFAFVILNFKELEFDWNFFERIRTIRNKNKYLGIDISREVWKDIEFQINLYISTLEKEIVRLLK